MLTVLLHNKIVITGVLMSANYKNVAAEMINQATVCGELIVQLGLTKRQLLDKHGNSQQCIQDLNKVTLDASGKVLNIHQLIEQKAKGNFEEIRKYEDAVNTLIADRAKWQCRNISGVIQNPDVREVMGCEIKTPTTPASATSPQSSPHTTSRR